MKIISPSLPHRVISGGNKALEKFGLLLCPRLVKSWDISSLLFFCFLPSSFPLFVPKPFSRWELIQLNFALLCPRSQQGKVRGSRQLLRACFTQIYQMTTGVGPKSWTAWISRVLQWHWALPSSPAHFCCSAIIISPPPALPVCVPSCLLSLSREIKSLWAKKVLFKVMPVPRFFFTPSFPRWPACALGKYEIQIFLEHGKQEEHHKQQHLLVNAAQCSRASWRLKESWKCHCPDQMR